ncbi:MAG: DUF4272 domain-containing protein [Flavipsychrobacter sp.]|nr:DUF4272 domain-containing protein [Flavipsychrobacter sp.]
MTPQERKANTESRLKELNIRINTDLPMIVTEDEVNIRSAANIAKRILILTYLNIVVLAESFRGEVVASLKNKGLWDDVSGNEKLLLLKAALTEQDKIFISWQAEATWMLLWVINKVEITDLPTLECDINEILKLLPSFQDGPETFIESATSRPTSEILDMLDIIYRLHWATSDAETNEEPIPADLNAGVIHERHYALNWVTRIVDKWDEDMVDK